MDDPRTAAAKQGLRFYRTGKPCKHNHVADRYVSTGQCAMCMAARYPSGIRLKNRNQVQIVLKCRPEHVDALNAYALALEVDSAAKDQALAVAAVDARLSQLYPK